VAVREAFSYRIAAGRDGCVRVGTGEPGRGAWLCGADCLDAALSKGRLDRALRRRLEGHEQVALRARLGR
jgi:predicted RNA-binding protein YlxR (DUF448 family)